MTGENLLGVPPTLLSSDEVGESLSANPTGDAPQSAELEALVRRHPTSSLVWALLSDRAFEAGQILPSYAYARVGYHRGLDALRKGGWRGQGPVPWSHEPNRGVLRSLYALRRAAGAIGENDEVVRLTEFLNGADATAAEAIENEQYAADPATPASSAAPSERL
ncbi:DUF3151 domain-containing protein [Subtercola boreus]|uniref:DUF3151 domain-containing protein n=1 Tax=Subtercola boreus TaxID=120213 RepID=A0A3E0W6V4_9MICO|nr:DUF3151 domain-containing protein [Subtercola boreus]RFA17979.1 hypothetical protein B7R24_15065 [Subtercola boreus]RFA18361.1 hypothetical protein B7R23_15100 [Subtercola boreus]RFA24890.1 hypothetical protein B7R25_15095 [Subtercola boreus]